MRSFESCIQSTHECFVEINSRGDNIIIIIAVRMDPTCNTKLQIQNVSRKMPRDFR